MPRQLYGLGSLVKSITKGVKKIAKSPIGKIGLAALATVPFGGPAALFKTAGSFFGTGSLNPLKALLPNVPGMEQLGYSLQPSKFGKFLGSGLGKTLALTVPSVLAAAGVEEEQIADLQQNKPELIAALRRGYKNLNPGVADEEVEEFVRTYSAEGGRIGYARGDTAEDNAMQASGIMGLPLNENPAGITELDLRETGGFIPPVGVKEKADDIPAMLSNNELVFTADAVRGMGGGDVDKGAERMYAMMKTLENGGRV